jgi:hypothetical protein
LISDEEKFEVAKGIVRGHESKKDSQYNGQNKGPTAIYKTLHRKPKTEPHESYWKSWMNAGSPEGSAVPVLQVAYWVYSLDLCNKNVDIKFSAHDAFVL